MTQEEYLKGQIAYIETHHKAIIFNKQINTLTKIEHLIYKRWSKMVDELTDIMWPNKKELGNIRR